MIHVQPSSSLHISETPGARPTCQLLHHPLSVHLLSPLQAQHTAAVVNELSSELHKLLQHHPINQQRRAEGKAPANCVLLRGCGSRISVPSFEQLHGMKACLVAPTKIIAGD